jgi:phage terminase small subunit
MKLPRSKGGVDPRVRAQMNRFVEGLLMGLGSTQAAVFAGVASASAARTAQKYRVDPYVRGRFTALREKLTRDEICSFAEQALDVKSIAFDDSTERVRIRTAKGLVRYEDRESTSKRERIAAHALLANLMGHNAPTHVATTINGGVLLLPVADSMEAWESQAVAAQAALQKEVEQDANR